jgi:hypothetical protein
MRQTFLAMVLFGLALAGARPASAEPIAVRFPEGLAHGFLTLRSPQGALLATGDLIQTVTGDRVTSRLMFRFRDGSLHDETAVFTQDDRFQLLSDRLIQKGPAFETQLDMNIDVKSGQVTVRYRKEGEDEKTESEHLDMPDDLANGIIITLLKNVQPTAAPTELSLIAATPKPRLVKLKISSPGADPFSVAGSRRKATHYVVKVDLGGLAGVVAPLVGKQPPDSHVWILQGTAPAFVRSDSTLVMGGPLWRMDLASPVWRTPGRTRD